MRLRAVALDAGPELRPGQRRGRRGDPLHLLSPPERRVRPPADKPEEGDHPHCGLCGNVNWRLPLGNTRYIVLNSLAHSKQFKWCEGDIYGRRSTLIIAMFVNALFGAVSAASWDYATFLLLRFVSGLGYEIQNDFLFIITTSIFSVGGSIPLVWTYFAEFQPSRRRGGALSLLATFWMVGNVTVAGLAWAIIPHQLSWASWRWFTLACAGPSLLVCLVFILLPESPKFLLCQGRHDEALELLRTVFSKNTGEARSEYTVRALRREDTGEDSQESRNILKIIFKVFGFLKELFTGSLWKITLILLVINFSIQFGYYGLWYWFPELFNQLTQFYETNPNVTKTVCQIVSEEVPTEDSDEESFNCALYIPGDEVFINSFIVSLSALPSNLWTIFCMDKLGRKFFLCFSMILSGGTAFLIYLVQSSLMNLVLSCIFGAVSTMGFNSLDCLGK